MKTALDQTTWLPAEVKKVVDEWVKAYKQGRDELTHNEKHKVKE